MRGSDTRPEDRSERATSATASSVRSWSMAPFRRTESMGLFYYGAVVGAPKCAASPRSCDLSRGIVMDDETGTITFHLSTSRPRLPRETRDAYRGRGTPRSPPARLRSPPVACHRPVHDHPLRHQAVRPRTQPVLPRMVTGRATRRIPRSHRLAGLQEDQPGGFRGRARRRRLALLRDQPSTHSRPTRSKPTTQPRPTHPPTPPPTSSIIEPNSPLGRDHLARQAIAYAIDRDRLDSILNERQQQPPSAIDVPADPTQLPRVSTLLPIHRSTLRVAQKLVHRSPSYGKPVSIVSYVERDERRPLLRRASEQPWVPRAARAAR